MDPDDELMMVMHGILFVSDYLYKQKTEKPTYHQSLTWALQVALGMAHLHNHSITHRDLKFANIHLSAPKIGG